jgi:hypothetical protein
MITLFVRTEPNCASCRRDAPTNSSNTELASGVCNACPLKEDSFERVRAFHHMDAYKKAMNKRKVWVEPLFAVAKDWHGMRRFRLRERWRVNYEALMIATGQNLVNAIIIEDHPHI